MIRLFLDPFVLFTAPIWMQLLGAAVFWVPYLGGKRIIRWHFDRKARLWFNGDAYHRHCVRAYDRKVEPLSTNAWMNERKAGRA